MKVIIAGSRNINTNRYFLEKAVADSKFTVDEVVCGMAGRGVDLLAYIWASSKGIPIKEMPALWDTFGPKAGPIRNAEMVSYADALIAIWDGESPGTKDVIQKARAKKLKVHVVRI